MPQLRSLQKFPGGKAFGLRHSGDKACGIPDKDTIVMTGGNYHDHVTRYNANGFVEELPRLPKTRYSHACAALPLTGAFIVAGGYASGYTPSVLTLLPGASDWTYLNPLPQPLSDVCASIVGGNIRLSGGYDGSSFKSGVLEYPPEPSNQWITVGQLKRKRRNHGVLSITPELLPCLEGCLVLYKFTKIDDLNLL